LTRELIGLIEATHSWRGLLVSWTNSLITVKDGLHRLTEVFHRLSIEPISLSSASIR
jgi:hypothetical protein